MEDMAQYSRGRRQGFDSMSATDRVAITPLRANFRGTSDHELLKKSLDQISSRPLNGSFIHDCPEISYYQPTSSSARMTQALDLGAEDAVQCAFSGDETKGPG